MNCFECNFTVVIQKEVDTGFTFTKQLHYHTISQDLPSEPFPEEVCCGQSVLHSSGMRLQTWNLRSVIVVKLLILSGES